MLDYHLHLWPHGERDTGPTVEALAAYCDAAAAHGVRELAITEHLFRFVQCDALLGRWWENVGDPPELATSMTAYWTDHARADLDRYVEVALAAKAAGLPVVIGMEVDYHPGRMDAIANLLSGYPFDVLLGSVHWLGSWRFDDLADPVSMAEWDVREVEEVWRAYTAALEELAGTGACDVLAHPDLVKVAGRRPDDRGLVAEIHERIAEAAAQSGMAAEVSSAGWRKPVAEQYPAEDLLDRLAAHGVPLTTASDAHRLADVADRAADLQRLVARAGGAKLTAFRRRRPVPPAMDANP